jgi:hypothetical protein
MLTFISSRLTRIFLVLALVAAGSGVFGQTAHTNRSPSPSPRVSGKVWDSESGEGIAFATVLFLQNGVIVGGIMTDYRGKFRSHPMSPGEYSLSVRSEGYKEFIFPFNLRQDEDIEISILMKPIRDWPSPVFRPSVPLLDIHTTTYDQQFIREKGR